jgi:DNA-binding MarR family transcriptional regulator
MTEPPDYAALAEFRRRIREFLAFSEERARAEGLEPRQHQLLLAIKGLPRGERPTIRAVAERLRLRHNSVVELVDRLEKRGLVRRAPNPSDRREILVSIEPPGERLLRRLSLAHSAELRTAGPALVRALGKVVRASRGPRRRQPRRTR